MEDLMFLYLTKRRRNHEHWDAVLKGTNTHPNGHMGNKFANSISG